MRRTTRRRPPPILETTIRVHVDTIAAGGDGVARVEGLVVFVPRSAPGDDITVRARKHASLARGEITSIETPSPDRTDPPCRHYTRDKCGGCQLQHMTYDAQLRAKRGIISDAFERIAKLPIAPPDVVASPAEWRYRRKLTLAMRREGGEWIMGLHPYDAPAAVFDLEDCPITDERVLAIWKEVRAASRDLPEADELRAAVRLLDDGAALVVEGGSHWPAHERFANAVPSVSAIWWQREKGRPRLLHDRRASPQPGASFAQVNPGMAAELQRYAVELTMRYAPGQVLDAYAGSGDTADAIARRGARVLAIESDEDAARWCARRLPEGSRVVTSTVEDAIADALPADVVLLNPPRAGLDARVASALADASQRPRAIIYISCNPATLARDVARLVGFRIVSVKAFDMFPQTAHVETVCEMVPEVA